MKETGIQSLRLVEIDDMLFGKAKISYDGIKCFGIEDIKGWLMQGWHYENV